MAIRLEEDTRDAVHALHERNGRIAHALNNRLTGVIAYADMLRRRTNDDHTREVAESLLVEAKQAAALIGRLTATTDTSPDVRIVPESVPPAPVDDTPSFRSLSRPAPANAATVFLVDDSRCVREFVTDGLKELGYHVVACASAADAEIYFREFADAIDVVLLDLHLGGRDGLELLATIGSIDPQATVVLTSGDNEDPRRRDSRAAPACGWLKKPFSCALLEQAVVNACRVRRARVNASINSSASA